MNNRWAAGIVLLVSGIFALDYFYLEWNLPALIGYQLWRLIDVIAMWR